MGGFFSTLFSGLIVGALARLFLRGKQDISLLWTIVLGVVGSFLGWVITSPFPSLQNTEGVDWIRLIISVIAAMVLISGFIGWRSRK
ncbi:GlsB/YeaQ/YmgE family stress response membrane protein [Actinomyces vulturis]|uniref:GlsB/YeaQ/YmgE family stress response membrane protein n=1 Tax=Actinomyces vulturis TaxID=1857645 RepID=UPI0008310D45|nr:GlsB/YeaQ/YmgE family stress response membrane protein [Actinomyces vulturis]